MKNKILFWCSFLFLSVLYGQEKSTRFSNLQTDFFYGFPIEHDTSLNSAIQGNAYGFNVSWNHVSNKQNKFNLLYNFPEKGFTFLYENFNSDILGEVYSLLRHYTYSLNPKKNNSLKLTTAFGLAYGTKPYNEISNNLNFAYGSKLLVSALFKFQYIHLFKNNNLSFNSALSLIHFSNIAFKNPNLGINTVAVNVGFNYKLNPVETIRKDSIFSINKKLKYQLFIRGGVNESKIINSGLFPFFTASFKLNKPLNPYSTLDGGVEYFYSEFLKKYAEQTNIKDNTNLDENNPHRVGLFIGHELTQNNFAFITQLGVYLFNPIKYESWIYERFGFNYKLSEHLAAELTMKVNLFRAEALEFGIGYTF